MIESKLLQLLSPELFKYGVISGLFVISFIITLYNSIFLQKKIIKIVENNTRALSKVESALADCKIYRRELEHEKLNGTMFLNHP